MFHFENSLILDAERDYGYAREPVVGRMADGSLISFALSGGAKEPSNQNVVLVTRSYDDGRSWTEPKPIFRHGARGVWATELFTDGARPLLFVHTYDASCRYRELHTYVSTSTDNGENWSEPRSLPSGIGNVCVRRGITLSNGNWLFPVYWQETRGDWDWTRTVPDDDIGMQWPKHCGVMISTDRGMSFALHGDLAAAYPLWENAVAEYSPGRLLMLIRAERSGVLYVSRSEDYGLTWTAASPTAIPNPGSKFSLSFVRDQLVLIHNPSRLGVSAHKYRMPLAIWNSTDGGESWGESAIIASGEPMFYPHPIANEEEDVFLVACENDKKHYLVRVPFSILG